MISDNINYCTTSQVANFKLNSLNIDFKCLEAFDLNEMLWKAIKQMDTTNNIKNIEDLKTIDLMVNEEFQANPNVNRKGNNILHLMMLAKHQKSEVPFDFQRFFTPLPDKNKLDLLNSRNVDGFHSLDYLIFGTKESMNITVETILEILEDTYLFQRNYNLVDLTRYLEIIRDTYDDLNHTEQLDNRFLAIFLKLAIEVTALLAHGFFSKLSGTENPKKLIQEYLGCSSNGTYVFPAIDTESLGSMRLMERKLLKKYWNKPKKPFKEKRRYEFEDMEI
jgi:hypothetical protein